MPMTKTLDIGYAINRKRIHFKYSVTDFERGGDNTPKGIYNQNSQLKFRQWLGGVNAKAF